MNTPPTPPSNICHICKLPLDAPGAMHCSAYHKATPSSTPETDEAFKEYKCLNPLITEHARKLERERDEAKELSYSMNTRVHLGNNSENCPFCKTYPTTGTPQDVPMCHLCTLESERDSLQSQLKEYEKLFSGFDGGAIGLALHLSANESLRDQLSTLRKDKERLDWGIDNPLAFHNAVADIPVGMMELSRTAIDTAIQSSK